MATLTRASLTTGNLGDGCNPLSFLQSGLADLQASLAVWRQRSARRRAAVALDDRTLADIGLVRALIDHEAGKPFWKP
jgi:uncharacterized protein YjiS (DUF1127 family)